MMFKIKLLVIIYYLNLINLNYCYDDEIMSFRYKRSPITSDKRRSLVIIFDSTGSMSQELQQLREGAKSITNSFEKLPKNPIVNYVFVEFNDPKVSEPVITKEKDVLFKALEKIKISGGGDCEERCFYGIEKALLAANPDSYAFVFTDATSKEEERILSIKKLLSTKNIQLNFFVNAACGEAKDFKLYEELAINSNGIYFQVIESEIKIFENFAEQHIRENRQITGLIGSETGGTVKHEVAVDDTMKEITLTLIGKKPSVNILDPNNKIVNYETKVESENVKIIQVNQPMPGAWKIEVKSDRGFSGQISVLSDLIFYYGFSVNLTNSIQQTYYQPLLASKNILSVSTSDNALIGTLDTITIVPADKSLKPFDLVLTKRIISIDNIIYSTDPFDIPNRGFKIHLKGKDVEKHKISRLLSPVIEASNPDPPSSLPNYDTFKVEEGAEIRLFCEINSAIPITMKWIRDSDKKVLTEIKAEQSDLLKFIIGVAETTDAGSYTCVAENSLGTSESKTVVEVRSVPLVVTTPNKTIVAKENTTAKLKCVVYPKQTVKVEWFYNESDILPIGSTLDHPNLVIQNVKRDFSGTYKCVGTKKHERKFDILNLDVQYSPQIMGIIKTDDISTQTIPKSEFSINVLNTKTRTLTLTCSVTGNPFPEIKWTKDSVLISTELKINIDPMKSSSSGVYICSAKNIVANDFQKLKINVILVPVISPYVQDHEIKIKTKFKFSCPVVKNDATITWTFNNLPIPTNMIIINDELHINSADMSMHGMFKCQAENLAGKVEAKFNLNILYPPTKLVLTKSDGVSSKIIDATEYKVNIVNITSFSILCESEGNPPPTISWSKDGISFSTHKKLEINPRDVGSSGTYTCVSNNNLHQEIRDIKLEIYLQPEIVLHESRIDLIDGESTSINCPIRGHEVQYSWMHNYTIEIPQSMIKNDTLSIAKVNKSYTGKWKCIAQNLAGVAEVYFSFDVLYPPLKIDVTWNYINDIVDKKLSVMKGNMLNVACTSEANPRSEISWYKNNILIEDSNYFVINSVQFDDAGDYKCEVKNELGAISDTYELIVNSKPEFNATGYDLAENHKSVLDPNMMCVLDAINLPSTYYRANYQKILNSNDTTSFIILNCKMEGFPISSVEWWKNSITLNYAHEVLVIKPNIESSGIYKCTRRNAFGEVAVLYYVNIKKPVEVIYEGNTVTDVLHKQPFLLTCKSKGNFIPFLKISIDGNIKISTQDIFRHADQTLKNRLLAAKEDIYFDTNNIILEKEDITDLKEYGIISFKFENGEFIGRLDYIIKSYQYDSDKRAACFANNEDPYIKQNLRRMKRDLILRWNELPYYDTNLVSDYQEIERLPNAPFSLKCPISGTPEPQIFWYKDDVLIEFNAMKNLKPSSDRKLLYFTIPAENQIGIYKCIGNNSFGQTEIIYNVKILAKSTFDITNFDLSHNNRIEKRIHKNETLRLDCENKINNNTEFYWSKLIEVSSKPYQSHILYSNIYELVGDQNEVIVCSQNKELDSNGTVYEIKVLAAPVVTTVAMSDSKNLLRNYGTLQVKENEKIILFCEIKSVLQIKVKWIRDYDNRVLIRSQAEESDFLEFIIDFAEMSDTSTYSCVAENDLGLGESKVVVEVKLVPLIVSTPNKVVVVNENAPKTILKCLVSPTRNVKVDWLFNDQSILPIGSTLDASNLVIRNIKRDFSGIYKCIGTKNKDQKIATVKLDVQYAPEILGILKIDDYSTQTILKSEFSINVLNTKTRILKLRCRVTGNPTPEIKWKKDSVEIATRSEITIYPIKSSSGVYSCLAKNIISYDFQEIEINVVLTPILLHYDQNHKVVINTEFKLSCPVVKNDAIVTWTFNDSFLPKHLIYNDELNIGNADLSMHGIYKCKAENLAGKVEARFNLDVLYPPTNLVLTKFVDGSGKIIDAAEHKIDIVNMSSFSILCESEGNPPPIIYWRKGDVTLATKKFLRINTRDQESSGVYTCVSDNPLRQEIRDILLEIYLQPEIVLPYDNQIDLIDGESRSINCPIRGYKVQYSWIHNYTIQIPQSMIKSDTLSIAKVEKSHKGIWKCKAQNLAGVAEFGFKFDVLYPPQEIIVSWNYISDIVKKKLPVMKGNALNLTCTSEGNPRPEVNWYTNNILVGNSNNLYIKTVLFPEAGYYKCEVKNKLGIISDTYELIVNAVPKLLKTSNFQFAENKKSVINGNMMSVLDAINLTSSYYRADYQQILDYYATSFIKLDCSAEGSPLPLVEWWKNNKKLDYLKETIIMRNNTIKDSGIYKCTRRNDYGKVSVLFYLNIKKPVEAIYEGERDINTVYKQPVTLTCKSKGNYIPFLDWSIDGNIKISTLEIFRKADHTLKYRLLEAEEKIYFDIKNNIIDEKDIFDLDEYGITSFKYENGEFIGRLDYIIKSYQYNTDKMAVCFVNNEDEKSTPSRKEVKLHIIELPYFDSNLYSAYQEIQRMANAPFSLSCIMNGKPEPKIEWYKNGIIIDLNAMSNLFPSRDKKYLNFAVPTESESGIYKCIGKNKHGETKIEFNVKISTESRFDITDIDLNQNIKYRIEMNKSQEKKLVCSTERTDVEFYWSTITDELSRRYQNHFLHSNYYVKKGDQNEVIFCSLNKTADSFGVIYEIKVLEAPLITKVNKKIIINVTNSLELNCVVRGEPKPIVEWEKYDGFTYKSVDNTFSRSGDNLKKLSSTESDGGRYKCKATNKMGNDETEYEVIVKIVYEWHPWVTRSECSKICGNGTQEHIRTCRRKDTGDFSNKCEGSFHKYEPCKVRECPIDGRWNDWGPWSGCDKTCVKESLEEKSYQRRKRICNNPAPKFNGKFCTGIRVDTKVCDVPYCPQDGVWSEYVSFPCSVTCGDGMLIKIRNCNGPKNGGKNCTGDWVKQVPCNIKPCCKGGFKYDKNTAECEDIDECKENVCHQTQNCVNTIGSFECRYNLNAWS